MALKGTFDVLSFPDLMTVLAGSGATGRLLIRRRPATVTIELSEGRLVVDAAGDGSGRGQEGIEDICLELLEARTGSFEFRPEILNGAAPHTRAVDAVLGIARARLDQRKQFDEVLDLRPRPIALPDRENVTLSRDEWQLIMTADGRRSVRAIAKKLGSDERAVCLSVKSLVQEGVLELVGPVRDLVVKPPETRASIRVESSASTTNRNGDRDEDAPSAALRSILSLLRTPEPAEPVDRGEAAEPGRPLEPERSAEPERSTEPEATSKTRESVRPLVAVGLGGIFWFSVLVTRFRIAPGLVAIIGVVLLGLVAAELVLAKEGVKAFTRPGPRINWMAEFAIIVVLVLALDLVVEALVVKRYRTASGSMVPTIQVGQQLLVDRLAPQFQRPHRGDIIIFNPPAGAAINACGVDHPDDQPCPLPTSGRLATVFVKRVVGIPGDQVAIVAGRAYVNGKLQGHPRLKGDLSCDICDMRQAVTVPPGYFFVMGDNRDHSNDSRVWGPVPSDWIIGRVFLSYWPITRFRIF